MLTVHTTTPRASTINLQRHAQCRRPCTNIAGRGLRLRASADGNAPSIAMDAVVKYEHVLVALFDDNPYLSDSSRQHSSRVTILFVDEGGKELDASTRIEQIKGALNRVGCEQVEFVERQNQPNVGQGSVAVGDVADQLDADLVILPSEAVHSKHVDANLLAEFVPCPVLLLP